MPSPAGRIGPRGPLRTRRLLHLARDARLVEQIRRGNDAAFEVVFERHGPAILAFCRHMLDSPDDADDAVQHIFASAYRVLRSADRRPIDLKPWLFTIARNRCLSMLRARREVPVEDVREVPTEGLAEQVERRAELRRLVADVRELPDEQRAALLLTEVADLSHAQVAGVLGCEVARVKALVFRARSQLIARRSARDAPCEEIREQIATLSGGALRRTELRLHLRDCPGCRTYREEVRRQRQMLAAALPVVPTVGLKSSVLAAVGLGGSAGGATGLAGAIGGATAAKVAVVGALASGGLVAGESVVERDHPTPARPAQAAPVAEGAGGSARGVPAVTPRGAGAGPEASRRGDAPATRAPGRAPGAARGPERADRARGRGPIAAPPGTTPVRRGPPGEAGRPEKAGKPAMPDRSAKAQPERAGKPIEAEGPAKPAKGYRSDRKPAESGTTPAGAGTAGGTPRPADQTAPRGGVRADAPPGDGRPQAGKVKAPRVLD